MIIVLLICSVETGFLVNSTTASNDTPQNGAIWNQSQFDLPSSDLRFKDVKFVNSTHGWIVGEDLAGKYGGVVINTKDGGDSWNLQFNNTSLYHDQIDVIDTHTIWITGQGSLYYSNDGGLSWNESIVVTGSSGMSVVEFINETHGWTATMGLLYYTRNAGQSWQNCSGWNFNGDMPRDMHFISETEVWAIGFFGIYYSSDRGISWSEIYNRGGWALSFVNDMEAWAVADNMLAHMIDGQTWIEQQLPKRSPLLASPSYLTDVFFYDENNGWIVGGLTTDVHVMYTPNGGKDWYEQMISPPIISRLMAVDFVNQTHGWAVGSDGVIISTTEGNYIGTRLWTGLTDPVFLLNIGVFATCVILFSGGVYLWRKKKRESLRVRENPC